MKEQITAFDLIDKEAYVSADPVGYPVRVVSIFDAMEALYLKEDETVEKVLSLLDFDKLREEVKSSLLTGVDMGYSNYNTSGLIASDIKIFIEKAIQKQFKA